MTEVKTERRLTQEQLGTLRALELRTAAHGQLNTRTLRVLEQRGLVGFAIGRQHWFLKAAGRRELSENGDAPQVQPQGDSA